MGEVAFPSAVAEYWRLVRVWVGGEGVGGEGALYTEINKVCTHELTDDDDNDEEEIGGN
jgi:hypothetical protein